MRKNIVTGAAALFVASSIAFTVVPAVHAQVKSNPRALASNATPPASLGYEIVTVGPVASAVGGGFYQIVTCPGGKKVVGGGALPNTGGTNGNVALTGSAPGGNASWVVSMINNTGKSLTATFFAICIIAP
jgi:hypothetical protein